MDEISTDPEILRLRTEVAALKASTSWRITAPMRALRNAFAQARAGRAGAEREAVAVISDGVGPVQESIAVTPPANSEVLPDAPTTDACPAPTAAAAANPAAGTLADLDRLNSEHEDGPVLERLHAVGQFLLKVEGPLLDDAGDPFGDDYYDRAVELWKSISGRADYDPRRDELAPYVNPETSVLSPAFYASGDSRHAGENLAGIGFILQQLDLRKGQSLLEYGAGEGQISLHMARLGCQVSVIDVEQRYLDGILLQAQALTADITVQQGVFGDGFADGRRFDRILFFEAFHHALDHARVLRELHHRLNPGGCIVFACEPVIDPNGPWMHVVPYPWGPRLDGLSVNAMRMHGWCELGFREDYFLELLMRTGYLCTYHPCSSTALGNCHIARPHGGRVEMGQPFLIQVTGRDSGWHAPESGGRWTREHALLPLDQACAEPDGVSVEFFNFLPIRRDIVVRLASCDHAVSLAPGEQSTVHFDVPSGTQWLEIISPTDCLAPFVGDHDQRVVGIHVRTVTYGPIMN